MLNKRHVISPINKKYNNMNTIQAIFKKAGLSLNQDQLQINGKKIGLMLINNPDGTIRWIWPDHLKKPLFLKFYNITSFRSKLFAKLVNLIFILRLQKFIFRKVFVYTDPSKHFNPLFSVHDNWALFTGTTGPNRKAIFYIQNKVQSSFLKIACSDSARSLLYNESTALKKLDHDSVHSYVYPNILCRTEDFLQVTDISEDGLRCSEFNQVHLDTLRAISDKSYNKTILKEVDAWNEMHENLKTLALKKDSRIPKGLLQKLTALIENIDDSIIIETSMSHGDFTPWNMFENNDRLCVYDWELSRNSMPLGFDAFHFIIQQGILSDRKKWVDIHDEIRTKLSSNTFSTLSRSAEPNVDLYLKLYLILNTITYLEIYSRQEKWHSQVSWLLNTWNEALSTMASDQSNDRALLLGDVFDFLQDQPYAALKFPDIDPRQLSELSDVDLCMGRSDANQLIQRFKVHPLVSQSRLVKKSYMATFQMICGDGSLLSIDCIWKFKRKATVMMDKVSVIRNAIPNHYGVKNAAPEDQARFIGLFYTLNNTDIPKKYFREGEALDKSSDLIDKELFKCYQNNDEAKNSVKSIVGQKKENRRLWKWMNQLTYLIDTCHGLIRNRGMIITFSGVDGAGKSTVIDTVKMIIEKKLRRNVVVIRHRPSILPILSAWVEGKAAAEKKAASNLPRQGKNNNWISSLLRFSYYYTDYLLGQFVVYFRYVLRGHIVLYDRYYFDFINDSRRSNIQLPRFITKSGYKLLLKPDLNFFLYAEPELILSRKKELMASTIEYLTKKYLDLFEQLGRDQVKSRYIPIENIVLEDTIESIIQRMIKTAA
jgi:thymidylate kinase